MKQVIWGLVVGVALLAGLLISQAQSHSEVPDHLNWQTDLPQALAQAKTEKKLVFMDFTGSDWCETCEMLSKETFSQPEFAAYAETNLVLVKVDFPEHKKLPVELQKANDDLSKKFNVEGYPTLVVLRPDGTEACRIEGLPDGGTKGLIEKLAAAKKI